MWIVWAAFIIILYFQRCCSLLNGKGKLFIEIVIYIKNFPWFRVLPSIEVFIDWLWRGSKNITTIFSLSWTMVIFIFIWDELYLVITLRAISHVWAKYKLIFHFYFLRPKDCFYLFFSLNFPFYLRWEYVQL